ncbi:MAG: hypothetical protein IJG60_05725 [Thermoguttaceae bacterium]|nr:hypothetical protein [Thermoguttaceae bacterium]
MTKQFFLPALMLAALALAGSAAAQRAAKAPESAPPVPAPNEAAPGTPAGPGFFGRMMGVLDQSKNDEGNVDIGKAADSCAELVQTEIAKADANGDGRIDREELESVSIFRRPGFPGPSGPGGPFAGPRGQGGPFPDPLADARTEDGKIDLSKLPEQMPEPFRKSLTDADTDGDGFLSAEERAASMNRFRDPFADARTEDGKLDLSKLPEQMPEPFKQGLIDADADGDGFLSGEEQAASMNRFQGPPRRPEGRPDGLPPRRGRGGRNGEGNRPPRPNREAGGPRRPAGPMSAVFDAINSAKDEDGAIPAADKVAESVRNAVADSMKKADKNGDGVLSEEEVRDLFPQPPRGERGRRGRGPGQRPER